MDLKDIRFIDFDSFKHAINNLLNLISSKANKTDLHSHINKEILDKIDENKINDWNSKTAINDNDINSLTSTLSSSKINNQIQDATNGKVDKIDGKILTSNDFSDEYKNKLNGIEDNANHYIHPDTHNAEMIIENPNKQFVSEEDIQKWDSKASTDYVDSQVGGVTGLAPETLNSLGKLAAAIGNDPDFVNSITEDINQKVDKIDGKSLSTNDFTDDRMNKLAGIEYNANKYIHPLKHDASIITQDENNRFVSDIEKLSWNSKAEKQFVLDKISELINSSPESLDTLKELANALGNDANFSTTILNLLSGKVDKIDGKGLSTNDYTDEDKLKVKNIGTDTGGGSTTIPPDLLDRIAVLENNSVIGKPLDSGYFTMSTSQNYTSSDIIVKFDTTISNKNIALNPSTYSFFLKKGITYEIDCSLSVGTTSGYVRFALFEDINNTQISLDAYSISPSYNTATGSPDKINMLYTPTKDCNIYCKVFGGSTTTITTLSYIIIKEANRQIILDPMDVRETHIVEYGCFGLSADQSTDFTQNSLVHLDTIINGNLKSLSTNTVRLTANKTYHIEFDFLASCTAAAAVSLQDKTNGININYGYVVNNFSGAIPKSHISAIYTPPTDCDLAIVIISPSVITRIFKDYTKLVIQEIAQPVVIEYNNPNVIDPFDAIENHVIQYTSLAMSAAQTLPISTDGSIKTKLAFDKILYSNMSVNTGNNTIHLTAGKTYNIYASIMLSTSSRVNYSITDTSGNVITSNDYGIAISSNYNEPYVDSPINIIFKPNVDIDICVLATAVMVASTIINYPYARFIVQEIAQPTVIEYTKEINNEISNPLTTGDISQESPVGTVITYIGTSAPVHYLLCNGAEYNIADYQKLADYIKNTFGKYNYYGGDGITTFAVPLKVKDLKNAIPFMTSDTTPYGIATSSSNISTDTHPYLAFSKELSGWLPSTLPATLGYEFVTNEKIVMYSIKLRGSDSNDFSSAPKSWTFEGWNGSSWIVLDTRTNIVWNSSYEERFFGADISKVNSYKKYRINISASNGAYTILNLRMYTGSYDTIYCIKYEPTYYAVNQYGGFESKVLFDGAAVANSTYKLADNVTNYDFIVVQGGTGNGKNVITSNIIPTNTIDFTNGGQFTLACYGFTDFYYYMCFYFTNSNTLNTQTFNLKGTGWLDSKISKIIGYKGQIPSFLVGGSL